MSPGTTHITVVVLPVRLRVGCLHGCGLVVRFESVCPVSSSGLLAHAAQGPRRCEGAACSRMKKTSA